MRDKCDSLDPVYWECPRPLHFDMARYIMAYNKDIYSLYQFHGSNPNSTDAWALIVVLKSDAELRPQRVAAVLPNPWNDCAHMVVFERPAAARPLPPLPDNAARTGAVCNTCKVSITKSNTYQQLTDADLVVRTHAMCPSRFWRYTNLLSTYLTHVKKITAATAVPRSLRREYCSLIRHIVTIEREERGRSTACYECAATSHGAYPVPVYLGELGCAPGGARVHDNEDDPWGGVAAVISEKWWAVVREHITDRPQGKWIFA